MKNLLLLFFSIFLISQTVSAQVEDYHLGSMKNIQRPTNGGYYDYSDPIELNMKVSVWGYVKYPGKYTIPAYSTVNDLISYSGGPTKDARLEKLRLYRAGKDSTRKWFEFNYNDLLWGDSLSANTSIMPELHAGDILLVPGDDRLFFRDWAQLGLSFLSVLISLSILILNISRG